MREPIDTYSAFWGHYLREHGRPATRAVHYAATAGALALLLGAVLVGDWRLLLAALGCGYGLAWIAHAALERNRPATFGHPVWSLLSDLRMLALFATGRLGPHLDRHIRRTTDTTLP